MSETITIKIDLSKRLVRVLERLTGMSLEDPKDEFEAGMSDAAVLTSNEVEKWIAAHLSTSEGETISASALYSSFRRWCDDYDVKLPSHKLFALEMSRRGYQKQKKNGAIFYSNIVLNEG